jgi:hypothetical protein
VSNPSGCSTTIPGTGTFFVGIDIVPGRYRCPDGKGGWWVRFTGSGGDRPVGMWPLPPGPAEVDIATKDFAFETRVPSRWELVSPASETEPSRPTPRAVADPNLRGELDALVSDWRHRLRVRASPMSVLALWFAAFLLLGSWWRVTFVPIAIVTVLICFLGDDVRRARALRRRQDRYLTPEDFDEQGRDLLARTQDAIDTVRESQVNKEGLLDATDNAVTLPRQEWEIAQVLARQSKLRGEQRDWLESGTVPEVQAAVRPLREKLELSVQGVTRRIEALERYAERTRAADEAFRAQRHLEDLAARAHEYDDLIADTVRDDIALDAIERLTEQSDELVRTLRERLAEATGAAAELPAELPSQPPGPAGGVTGSS